ncbi:MAG: hypothetical protein NVSMB27_39230 [Ktedonobacteraceae bacterium]
MVVYTLSSKHSQSIPTHFTNKVMLYGPIAYVLSREAAHHVRKNFGLVEARTGAQSITESVPVLHYDPDEQQKSVPS